MNVIGTFMFVLLPGILDFVTAYEEKLELSEVVPSHLVLLGYINTTTADIDKYEQELCMKNGGPNAYDTHRKSIDHMSDCIYTVFFEVNHENSVGEYSSESNRLDDYVKRVCQRVSELEICCKNVTNEWKICLDPDKHESTNIIYNIMTSVMNFMCEGPVKPLEVLLENGAPHRCFNTNKPALLDCAQRTIIKYVKATITNGAAIGPVGGLHLLLPDANKCAIFEKFRVCTVEVLKTCPTSTAADLTDSTLKLVKDAMTCDRFSQSKFPSQASRTSVVNSLLMTFVLVTFLPFGKALIQDVLIKL